MDDKKNLDQERDRRRDRFIMFATVVVNISIGSAFVALFYLPSTAPMVAKVLTQIWSVDTVPDGPLPSYLNGPVIVPETSDHACPTTLNGEMPRATLEFPSTSPISVRITLVAIDRDQFSATFSPLSDGSRASSAPYAYLVCDEAVFEITGDAIFIYSPDRDNYSAILASGAAKIGRLPNDAAKDWPRMLIEGRVVTSTRASSFMSGRIEVESPLSLGDEVVFLASSDPYQIAQSRIIAVYDSTIGAFQLVVHSSKAIQAEVYQYGTRLSYPILNAPSPLERLKALPEWALLLGLWALVLNTVAAYRHYEILRSLRKINQPTVHVEDVS